MRVSRSRIQATDPSPPPSSDGIMHRPAGALRKGAPFYRGTPRVVSPNSLSFFLFILFFLPTILFPITTPSSFQVSYIITYVPRHTEYELFGQVTRSFLTNDDTILNVLTGFIIVLRASNVHSKVQVTF